MKRRLIVAAGVTSLILLLGIWASVEANDARNQTQVLIDRLAGTPVPPTLQLVDERSSDGTLLSAGRPREATRVYVLEGDVAAGCRLIDHFYAEAGVGLRRFDTGGPDCARSIRGEQISIWIETIKPFSLVPDEYKDRPELVMVRYSAF